MGMRVCYECNGLASDTAYACPSCGYQFKNPPHALGGAATDGVFSGLCSAVFAVLGIFTLGWIFVPFAVLFTLISLAMAISGLSTMGMCAFLFSAILTAIGIATSPGLWLLVLAIFGAAAGGMHQ